MTTSPATSIADAARWLHDLAEQVAAVFRDLDELAAERGCYPLKGSHVNMSGGKSLDRPGEWMRTYFGRGYAELPERGSKEPSSLALIFEIWLAPGFECEEAVALGVRLDLARPRTTDQIYDELWWKLGTFLAKPKAPNLDLGQVNFLSPQDLTLWNPALEGSQARMLGTDLTCLTDRGTVNERLFRPLSR